MRLIFPVDHCPNCQGTQFKVHATHHGTTAITFNSNGETCTSKKLSEHLDRYRKSWVCANCNTHLFDTNDLHTAKN